MNRGAGLTGGKSGEHRRTRSSVTGRYYCIFDGDDWPCAGWLAEHDAIASGQSPANDDTPERPIGAEETL